jgi:HEPN domain-containing protein
MKAATKNWVGLAEEDYATSLYLFKGARYPYAVYVLCQALEKLLKAAQVEFAHGMPKKVHNLPLLARSSGLTFSAEQRQALKALTRHYQRVRYRDLAQAAYNTKAKVAPIIEAGKELFQWTLTQSTSP